MNLSMWAKWKIRTKFRPVWLKYENSLSSLLLVRVFQYDLHQQYELLTACWKLKFSAAKSLQSCPTLCDPIEGSPPGFPIPGILQARTLEWVAISFSNAWKWKVESESEVAQSCPTLSDPMDCSPLGSSVHGSFQARVLEWGTSAFSNIIGQQCAKFPFSPHSHQHLLFSVFLIRAILMCGKEKLTFWVK